MTLLQARPGPYRARSSRPMPVGGRGPVGPPSPRSSHTFMSKDDPGPAGGETLDLLAIVRRSGVLTDRLFREVRAKVEAGEYPKDPTALADRLVHEGVLTRYQADRLLRNKAHGLVVDRYVILERLGEGAMARVYKAHHRLMGRVVAIKVIAPRYASRARSVARFQREMRLIGRLDHPHIIRA